MYPMIQRNQVVGCGHHDTTTIYNDNKGAVMLGKHQHSFKINKHFDIWAKWIREGQDAQLITLEHIDTNDNRADIFTKSLTADKTCQMRLLNGIQEQPS
jgi:hypothetical protein